MFALLVEVNMAAQLSPTPLSLSLNPKSLQFISHTCSFSPFFTSVLNLQEEDPITSTFQTQFLAKSWSLAATGGIFSLSGAIPDAIPEEILPTSDKQVSTVISALLFSAFIGLSVLTIGVIYIAVTDFLQKRERDKFDKEEAAQKKKNSKRRKIGARARAGPRGFGQKIEGEGDDAVAAD